MRIYSYKSNLEIHSKDFDTNWMGREVILGQHYSKDHINSYYIKAIFIIWLGASPKERLIPSPYNQMWLVSKKKVKIYCGK
jgi:hypothetical protein